MRVLTWLRAIERATRPENPEFAAAERRWREVPDHVKAGSGGRCNSAG